MVTQQKYFNQSIIQINWFISFWIAIYGLVIFQDYLYASFRHTGFYWSEVLLFNSYWLIFIPMCLGAKKLISFLKIESLKNSLKVVSLILISLVFSIIHVFLFTAFITLISNLVFTPAHQFMMTLIASISNDFYLTFLVYGIIPFFFLTKPRRTLQVTTFNEPVWQPARGKNKKTLRVMLGRKWKFVESDSIYSFIAEKPYTMMYAKKGKMLLTQSLKGLEDQLDKNQFLRVHRSAIVNSQFIKEINSRKNGDYDVLLQNGETIRFSRHYRKNWERFIKDW